GAARATPTRARAGGARTPTASPSSPASLSSSDRSRRMLRADASAVDTRIAGRRQNADERRTGSLDGGPTVELSTARTGRRAGEARTAGGTSSGCLAALLERRDERFGDDPHGPP